MTRHTSFWDRRRAAVHAEEVEAERLAEAQVIAECQADKTDQEILAELDLPDPETLQAGDDFRAFMAKAVPAHLRSRALRKLWVSDPVLACLDDLVDYADDYTQASAVTNFTTSYEVGKGLRRHVEAMARKAAASLDGETVPDDAETEVEEPAVLASDAPQEVPRNEHSPEPAAMDEGDAPALPPRRMTFRFEDQTA